MSYILKRFMIYDSSEGHHESTEGDKLLYHWTKEAPNNKVSLAEQIDDVCLCDASINFSTRFDSNHDDQTKKSLVLTFEKTSILILQIEQSIWMAVHVAPTTPLLSDNNSGSTSTYPSMIPIERVMNNIYTRFCLLNGNIQSIRDNIRSTIEQEELVRTLIRNRLRSVCESYFDNVLPDLHLNSIISNVALLNNYILYLDLNPITLMKVISFINHLVCINANQIRHTIVIFNKQLLWSSLNMHDTRLLYNYLISVLVRDAMQEELRKEVAKIRKIKEDLPIYLTEDTTGTYVERLNKFYFTVFRSSNNMTLGLILNEPNLIDLTERCEQILTTDSRLGVIPLASLAQLVGQEFIKASSHSSFQRKPERHTE